MPKTFTYCLPRDDHETDLEFRGIELGSTTTWHPSKVRWTEFVLYQTEGGAYVLKRVGVSQVNGEIDLHSATVHHTLEDLVEALTIEKKGGERVISYAGLRLLEKSGIDLDLEIDKDTTRID